MTTFSDILLTGIRNDAEWLTYYGNELRRRALLVQDMPSFVTEAEGELERAQQALVSALEAIDAVTGKMRPVERLQAAE